MPGKRSSNKEGEWKDISSQVGFFYSPVDNRNPIRRQLRRVATKYKPPKRKFAQSNFRLILNSVCDESKYIHDANKDIEWEDVASVEWCVEKEDCCSLCLMPHTAPRVLSCGHCFCFACIQQYFVLQPDAWVKCPVCSVLVEKHSIRPVRFIHSKMEIKVGSVLSMNLVVRNPDSINAFCADNPLLPYYLKHPIPPADAIEEDTHYCHLLYNTPYYELSLLQENLNALDTCEREMNLIGEVYLLKSMRFARESICSRIEALHAGYGESILPSEPGQLPYPPSPTFLDSVLFYYTLPWRLSYHLLPLSFQCIRNSFGPYHLCPGIIQAKVLEIEDLELSNRECSLDKTLQHLPMQSVAHYIELDVRMIVHERIDKKLWDMIKKRELNRRQENRQKKIEERRMDRKIKREEIQYFEEYAPYMLGEEEEQPNMTDCQAFPMLQGKETPTAVKVNSVWSDSSKSVIGVNSSLKSRLDNGKFPTLGQSSVAKKPTHEISQLPSQPNPSKKKEKKKPVTILSF